MVGPRAAARGGRFDSGPEKPFMLPAPDGKASVLHTDMTRLDPGREYQHRWKVTACQYTVVALGGKRGADANGIGERGCYPK